MNTISTSQPAATLAVSTTPPVLGREPSPGFVDWMYQLAARKLL